MVFDQKIRSWTRPVAITLFFGYKMPLHHLFLDRKYVLDVQRGCRRCNSHLRRRASMGGLPRSSCLGGPVNFGKETNCSATISVQKPMVGVLGMMVVEHRVYRPVGLAGKFSESVRLRTLLYTLLIGHRRYPMVPSAERSTALASPTPAY